MPWENLLRGTVPSILLPRLNSSREESSLFQPGSEVFLDKQPSLLETVQDFVQHDIVESVVESKLFLPATDDPLGVMEPRPGKNISEESLLRGSPSVADIYELLVELNKRISIIDERLESLNMAWPRLIWNRLGSPNLVWHLCKAATSVISLLFLVRFILKFRK